MQISTTLGHWAARRAVGSSPTGELPPQVGDLAERPALDAVVDPRSAALPGDQARLAQHLRMVGDRRAARGERAGQVAHADLAALM